MVQVRRRLVLIVAGLLVGLVVTCGIWLVTELVVRDLESHAVLCHARRDGGAKVLTLSFHSGVNVVPERWSAVGPAASATFSLVPGRSYTGKRMRHVKLRPEADVDATALTDLIETAYADMRRRLDAE